MSILLEKVFKNDICDNGYLFNFLIKFTKYKKSILPWKYLKAHDLFDKNLKDIKHIDPVYKETFLKHVKLVNKEYTKKIMNEFEISTKKIINFGNYTYYYVLPYLYDTIINHFPELEIYFELFEPANQKELEQVAPEYLFSGHNPENNVRNFRYASKNSFFVDNEYIIDEFYLSSSANIAKKHNYFIKNILKYEEKLEWITKSSDNALKSKVASSQLDSVDSMQIKFSAYPVLHYLMKLDKGLWIYTKLGAIYNEDLFCLKKVATFYRYSYVSKNADYKFGLMINKLIKLEFRKRNEKIYNFLYPKN